MAQDLTITIAPYNLRGNVDYAAEQRIELEDVEEVIQYGDPMVVAYLEDGSEKDIQNTRLSVSEVDSRRRR